MQTMRRCLLSVCLACALMTFLTSCSVLGIAPPGDVEHAHISIGSSQKYTNEEIQSAMDIVLEKFASSDFKDCTLTELAYDETTSDAMLDPWYGMDLDAQSIILQSSFETVHMWNLR